jgi:hypothetical protein
MMMPGDDKIVAERLAAILATPPKRPAVPATRDAAGDLNGRWDVHIEFLRGAVDHVLVLEQKGANVVGTHFGEHLEGEVSGVVTGSNLKLRSSQRFEGTTLRYRFEGELKGDQIAGTLNLGEYGMARWTAAKHQYKA